MIDRASEQRVDVETGLSPGQRALSPARSVQTTPVVFVVDTDVVFCASVEALARTAGWKVETFASTEQFRARPRLFVPGCLILDMTLPCDAALALQKYIAAGRNDLPIVLVAARANIPMTVRAMKVGAVDFFMKPVNNVVLLGSIERGIERSQATLREEVQVRAFHECYALLSHRERDVMALVVSGLLNKQVGLELGISEITVKAHRGNVMRKMRAGSLANLVRIAGKLGLSLSGDCRATGSVRRWGSLKALHGSARTPGASEQLPR